MSQPLVTLTSDFGTADPYVAQMKGVLLSAGPADLRLVDLTHELLAQDIRGGALFLEAAVPRFADGTIHLAVVDPTVGSRRRGVVVETGGQLLVGPDNGLFGLVSNREARWYELPNVADASATFHGRDVFAPAAAALAGGAAAAELGTSFHNPVELKLPVPQPEGDDWRGQVLHVDRFGNLITNLGQAELLASATGDGWQVWVGQVCVGAVLNHYGQVAAGQLLAYVGSQGRLEVALNGGSATQKLSAGPDTEVRITRS